MIVYCGPCRTHWNIQFSLLSSSESLRISCPRCEADLTSTTEVRQRPWLEVIKTDSAELETPERYPILGTLTVGRDPGNELQLLDGRVSRVHARVHLEDGQYFIEDRKSRNGTFVNGERLEGETVLINFDQVQIGGSVMRFRNPGTGEETLLTCDSIAGEVHDPADPTGTVSALRREMFVPIPVREPPTRRARPPIPGAGTAGSPDGTPDRVDTPQPVPRPPGGDAASPRLATASDRNRERPPGAAPSPEASRDSRDADSRPSDPRDGTAPDPRSPSPVKGLPPDPPPAPATTAKQAGRTLDPPGSSPLVPRPPSPPGTRFSPPAPEPDPLLRCPGDPGWEEGDGYDSILVAEVPAGIDSLVSSPGLPGAPVSFETAYRKLLLAFQVSQELKNIPDQTRLLNRALDVIFDIMPAHRGAVFTEKDGSLVLTAVKFRDEIDRNRQHRFPRTLMLRARQERKSILTRDALQNAPSESVLVENIHSAMTVPLISRERFLGLVHVDSPFTGGVTFTSEDLEIITGIGSQIALAIDDANLIRQMLDEQEVRKNLSRYLNPALVEQVANREIDLEPGGVLKVATILFSDIRGFTSMSEKMAPEDVTALLNEYFELMVDIVFKHSGTLDKYIGDALMASWGVPVGAPQDALRAVHAALDMQTEIEHFNQRRRLRGEVPIAAGIGINTGQVLAGNIGSSKRMEYTVIGDHVNLASRTCSIAKAHEVVITQFTYDQIRSHVSIEPLPRTSLKGKSEEVDLYRVVGLYQTEDRPSSERRRALRMKVAFSVMWSHSGIDASFHGMLEDISETGCSLQVRMAHENAFKFNDLLVLGFQTPVGDPIRGLLGRVVAIQYLCNARSQVYYDLKIHFTELTAGQREGLKRLTATLEIP